MINELKEAITTYYESANGKKKVAIYGIGTETERFISQYSSRLSIVGLLDGFRESGEIYGYPIIPLSTIPSHNVSLVIVIARPGSCKAIAKRIGDFCEKNNIALFDVRGKNLIISTPASYDFSALSMRISRGKDYGGNSIGSSYGGRRELYEKIESANVVSFDLFDTLVMRKIQAYYDVFDVIQEKLSESGMIIPDFSKTRLALEKEMSKYESPRLEKIYEQLLQVTNCNNISANELATLEYETDCEYLIERKEMAEAFRYAVALGKKVFVTTDTYYSRERIEKILKRFNLVGYTELLVSSEKNTYKIQNLFDYLRRENPEVAPKNILHIGDDEKADIECSAKYGISSFKVFSGSELWDELGELGTTQIQTDLADKVKIGLFISRVFNNPFVFENDKVRISIPEDIGYLIFSPMISDFSLWFENQVRDNGIEQTLLCARDGYLIHRMWKCLDESPKSVYFLTSRTAAIRSGMDDNTDIAYVDSMKYGGPEKECLRVRFGINDEYPNNEKIKEAIKNRAKTLRTNYKTYIHNQEIEDVDSAIFDFVAKGTTQLYLSKMFTHHLKGFYFLQLEPEFMKNKKLDIVSFYSDEERDTSEIYDNYYILETIVTSPFPSVDEFNELGEPVYAKETRSKQDIDCIMKVQDGIEEYFNEYIRLVPNRLRKANKKLDEVFLSLINKFEIEVPDFISLTVEDPFFGRMTDVKDLIGNV